MSSWPTFQHEFLIQLAPVWLACRWKVMGGKLHGWPHPSNLPFDLLGLHDYALEMQLACEEIRKRICQR